MSKRIKYTLFIAAILITVILLVLLAVKLSGGSRQTPEFVFSTPQTTVTTTSSATQSTAATTAPQQSEPEQAEEVTLLTSIDPKNHMKFTFSGGTIYIEGCAQSLKITDFYCGAGYAEPVYDGNGNFTAELPALTSQEYENILVWYENGAAARWRLHCTEDGVVPVLCEDIIAQSSKAVKHIIDIPADIVNDYIVTGGTAEQREAVLSEVSEIAGKVCDGLTDDMDKARAIAMWVSDNLYYDFDAYNSSVTTETLSLGSTLSLHRSVCGGYANLYAAMCQSQGLECYIVQGGVVQNFITFAENTNEAPSHEWNLLMIDGERYWVDTLWNNSDNFYSRGMYYDGATRLRYFAPTDEVMAQNHHAVRVERRDFFPPD